MHHRPDQKLLLELLRLDVQTGKLFWRARDVRHFKSESDCKRWNSSFAGKEAFATLNSRGYPKGAIFGRQYKAHQIVWTMVHGFWPEQIDHEDGDKTNNRPFNLREVSNSQNAKNKGRYSNNKSGYAGVSWHKNNNKYVAQIQHDGKKMMLGYFEHPEDAHAAYLAAKSKFNFHKNHGR